LSENESIEFIVENGIEIPDYLMDSPDLGGFVKWIIQSIEANPNFAENIKKLANNTTKTTPSSTLTTYSSYTLQDNTQYGTWNYNFSDYNCYIYSVGRNDVFKNPGYFSGGAFNIDMSIYEMAMLVKDDLQALGMGGVYVSNVRPDIFYPNETMIAIRKSTKTGWFVTKDYHLMKFHPDGGFWTHKPGGTAILKYFHKAIKIEYL